MGGRMSPDTKKTKLVYKNYDQVTRKMGEMGAPTTSSVKHLSPPLGSERSSFERRRRRRKKQNRARQTHLNHFLFHSYSFRTGEVRYFGES